MGTFYVEVKGKRILEELTADIPGDFSVDKVRIEVTFANGTTGTLKDISGVLHEGRFEPACNLKRALHDLSLCKLDTGVSFDLEYFYSVTLEEIHKSLMAKVIKQRKKKEKREKKARKSKKD
jgi:hypothetical protein